jgi:hypothetical protein
MGTAQTTTVIGYDVDSGKVAFRYHNTLVKARDGTLVLPTPGQVLKHNEGCYRVVRVREGSTEAAWEIDVREETANL